MHGMYVTDISKMCMKNFNAEKIVFDKLQGFHLHIARGNTVSLDCSQFLVCSDNDPGVTLTYFTARSNLVTKAFL